MFSFARTYRPTVAALAGALAVALVAPAGPPAQADVAPAAAPVDVARRASGATTAGAFPNGACLASTICRLKNRIRWRAPGWTPEFCVRVSDAVLSAARHHDLPPSLLLAVMINESDLNENAFLVDMRSGRLHAKDSGLMGLRCVLDGQGRCTNGALRGMAWKTVMDPMTNIELGARELAKWRRGGVSRVTLRLRDAGGRTRLKEKYVPCQHKTHAYWAHYNHGPIYIDQGWARHYPHRIAVLYHALAEAMSLEAPELRAIAQITTRDTGRRARTPERPIEARHRKLCDQIREVAGLCAGIALRQP